MCCGRCCGAQTQAFHTLFHTDDPVLLGAPTGSGKTVSAELTMFRLWNAHPGMKVRAWMGYGGKGKGKGACMHAWAIAAGWLREVGAVSFQLFFLLADMVICFPHSQRGHCCADLNAMLGPHCMLLPPRRRRDSLECYSRP